MEVRKDTVVTFGYELRVDGEVVDASLEGEPVTVLVGHPSWLPTGLEEELVGLLPGAFRSSVPPERGAGAHDPEKVAVVGREEFPTDASIAVGEEFHAQNESGRLTAVRVVGVEGDLITGDENPEYAGKPLEYSGEIHTVREATPEEIVHGTGGVEH